MGWFFSNTAQNFEGLLAAYGVLCIIVKLTPTKKDDKILESLAPVIEKLEAAAKKVETSAATSDNGQG